MAEIWDGKTKYEIQESDEQRAERMKKWDQYLADGGAGDEKKSLEDVVDKVKEHMSEQTEVTVDSGDAKDKVEGKSGPVSSPTVKPSVEDVSVVDKSEQEDSDSMKLEGDGSATPPSDQVMDCVEDDQKQTAAATTMDNDTDR